MLHADAAPVLLQMFHFVLMCSTTVAVWITWLKDSDDSLLNTSHVVQGGLNVQRQKPYYPETWRCSCWQVDNPAGTFLAFRSLSKPPSQAALTASGILSK